MSINHANKTWLISISVVALVVCGFLALNSNWLTSGVESRLLKNGRFSEQGLQAVVIEATRSREISTQKAFLQKNPDLAAFLNSELQGLPLEDEWSQTEMTYFSRVSSALRHLLEGAEASVVKQALIESAGGEQRLTDYLDGFISLQKSVGHGYVSSLGNEAQQAVGEAVRLLASLSESRDFMQEIVEIAAWYDAEKGQRPSSTTYQEWLLQYAWELSSADLNLKPINLGEELQISIKKETDLTRLLSHSNEAVVKNAANLISVFVPKNAITALRFQLVRSGNNQERFLLLNAIKWYGEQRSQIEPQLKNMLRLTRDTDFQEKIMDTINHLHGRPNQHRLAL